MKNNKGFTLLEMVIAMSIFMMFLAVVLNNYISLTSAEQKANQQREAITEAKEIISYISQESREKSIDYDCYNDTSCGLKESTLSLIAKDELSRTIIKKTCSAETKLCEITTKKQSRENIASNWNAGEESPLHSKNLKIESALFSVYPDLDPYDFRNQLNGDQILSPQFQPVFHVILNIKRNNNDTNSLPIIIETSISSRIYN